MKTKTLTFAALGVAGAMLIGLSAPAIAAQSGGNKSFARDHRAKPKTIDHRANARQGGVKVTDTTGKPRKIPCYGNLC